MDSPKRIVIIQGHPDPAGGHFGHALAESYARGAEAAGHTVEVINVATLTFPLLRNREELERGAAPEAIQQAQAALSRADHILVVYPVWNGGLPALARGFFEQTFRPGFVFPDAKPGARMGFSSAFTQRKGLAGKTARVVVTMQMPAFVYRWLFRPHPVRNALRLAGVGPVEETLIGLVEKPSSTKREDWLRRLEWLGRSAR